VFGGPGEASRPITHERDRMAALREFQAEELSETLLVLDH